MQVAPNSPAGVRAKLVAREIDIVQRELDTKAVVYVMGRAHMHMRSQATSAFDWYAFVSDSNVCLRDNAYMTAAQPLG